MNLDELENHLRSRSSEEPTAALRDRVMNAVAGELADRANRSISQPRDTWYWAAAAAAALVVLNLSVISASQDEFYVWPSHRSHQMTTELQALRHFEAQSKGMFK